jgi:integrase/recombinase XerD
MKLKEAIIKFNAWRNFSVKKNTVASYRVHLNYLCLYLRNPEVEDVQYDHIIGYLKDMEDLDWDQNSFMVKCIAFRKFFEFCNLQKLKVFDPELIPIPDRDYKFPRILSDENYKKLLAIIPENNDPRHIRNKAIINLFWDAGLRLGELIELNIDDIKLDEMSALIKTEKSKSLHPIRKIFWTAETNENLKKWIDKRKHLEGVMKNFEKNALFISVCGIKTGRRIKKSGVGEMLRRYSHEAGFPEICNPHSFRHHYGRELAEKGANNSVISSLMGHATIQSSQVYTVLTSKMMEEQYTKFKRQG